MKRKAKQDVDRMEFRDGYRRLAEGDVLAVIGAYKARRLKRVHLRVFAGMGELGALPKHSKVDLYRIVNCKSKKTGVRRLGHSQIDEARKSVLKVLRDVEQGGRERPYSRRVLRHIAQGHCTCNEACVLLYYCSRRITQSRRMDLLEERERYARFRYAELTTLSGVPEANICRAVARLRQRGFLNTIAVAQANMNRFGLLFVDGWLLSLVRRGQKEMPRNKTTTPLSRNDNASQHETTTLYKGRSKREKKKKSVELPLSGRRETRDELFARLRARCEVELENCPTQIAQPEQVLTYADCVAVDSVVASSGCCTV